MNKETISKMSKKQIAMFGAMMGDALGMPHEFKAAFRINPDFVEHPLTITEEYKTYPVQAGFYTDDFSQQLCVEQHFRGFPWPTPFYEDMLEWQKGKYWPDGELFDIGNQTTKSLNHYAKNKSIRNCEPDESGNGSLMRILPVAFMEASDSSARAAAFVCGALTHNSMACTDSCAFYVQLVRELLKDMSGDVWARTARKVDYDPYHNKYEPGNGGVIDAMCVLKDVIAKSTSYKEAISNAIKLGGDTDTNACIVGGIAALVFGLDDLPEEWITFIQPSMQNQYVKQLFTV